jgi:hypothetical protein
MSLTDATKLIRHDPSNPKHKKQLSDLKKKLHMRRQRLEKSLDDVKRGIAMIDKKLKQKAKTT